MPVAITEGQQRLPPQAEAAITARLISQHVACAMTRLHPPTTITCAGFTSLVQLYTSQIHADNERSSQEISSAASSARRRA